MENVILGNCFEELKKIEDKSIDFIFTDPPYGITAAKWDKLIPLDKLWKEFNRVIKPDSVIAIFSSQPFTTHLINSNIKQFKYCWYWVKNIGTQWFHAKRMPIRKIEEICVFGGRKYYPQITDGHPPTHSARGCSNGKIYHGTNIRNYKGGDTTRFPDNILNFKCVSNSSRLHSSQKPLDLCEYIIKTYTKESDIVLDSFAGSGTIGIAAKKLNRQFILIEKEQESYDNILKRLFEINLASDKLKE